MSGAIRVMLVGLSLAVAQLLAVACGPSEEPAPAEAPAPAAPYEQPEAEVEEEPAEELEEEAMGALLKTAELLGSAQRLSFTADVEFDVRQDSGQLLEFGARRRATLRRPDRARVEVERRDGNRGMLLFDGQQVVLFDEDERVYASAEHPGSIDAMLDFTLDQLETPVPLADMLYTSLPDLMRERMKSGYLVGEETVDGIACDHLAFRTDDIDAQLWVARGDQPLPRRIVLSYKNAEGQPQFRADFVEWSLEPETPDSLFEFKPPEGAERLPFLVRTPPPQQEGAQ
jgi:hypothetical protein